MRFLKRLVWVVLTVIILLTPAACSKDGGKEKDKNGLSAGRYVETDITPPVDGWLLSFLSQNGSIVCFDAGLQTRYSSDDYGVNWTSSPGPGGNNDRYSSVRDASMLPDGSLLAQIQGEGLVIIHPDGNSEHYPVPEIDRAVADGRSFMITLLKVLENDRLLLDFNTGGMVVQDSRPIGAAPIGGSTIGRAPAGGDSAGGSPVEGGPIGGGPIELEPDGQNAAGQQMTQAAPQRPGSQDGGAFSGNSSAFSMDSMSRQTSLYELSSGKYIASLPVESVLDAACDNDNVYLLDGRGYINTFRLSDGAPSSKPAINLGGAASVSSRGPGMLMMPGFGGGVLAVTGGGDLLALYEGNILLCTVGGDVETAMEGTAYSIGAPNSSATSVFALDDGSIIVNMLDNMQSTRLYRYYLDENAGVDPEKTLTIWSLEDNSFVRAAIAELRKANPDSYIKYEVALSGDNAVSASDAIKTLNTRLLNGNGPDVLILDGCPADSYTGKGMLIDLAGRVNTGDIYSNLLDPYVSGGKMFSLPTQFIMPALLGSGDSLDRVSTLSELVNAVVSGNDSSAMRPGEGGSTLFSGIPEDERAELYFDDVDELCSILWLSCAPAIVDGARLDSGNLRIYLEAVKAISDKYDLARPGDETSIGMSVAFASGGRATVLPSSLVRYSSQFTNYGAFFAENLTLLQLMMDREGSRLAPFPGLVRGAWRPSTVVGVSADSSVESFAVEFVNTMISQSVQEINYGEGLPVTRGGIAAQIRELNDRLAETGRSVFNLDMDSLIGELTSPSVNDSALVDMISGSVVKLCAGKLDVEGTVKEIEQNVRNYLAERA